MDNRSCSYLDNLRVDHGADAVDRINQQREANDKARQELLQNQSGENRHQSQDLPFVYWTKTDKKGNATDTLSASKVLLKSGMNEGTALLSTNEKYISFEIDKNCVRGALDKKAATYKSDSDKVYKIATVKDMKDVAIKISDSTAIMFTPATIKDMKKKANAGEQSGDCCI